MNANANTASRIARVLALFILTFSFVSILVSAQLGEVAGDLNFAVQVGHTETLQMYLLNGGTQTIDIEMIPPAHMDVSTNTLQAQNQTTPLLSFQPENASVIPHGTTVINVSVYMPLHNKPNSTVWDGILSAQAVSNASTPGGASILEGIAKLFTIVALPPPPIVINFYASSETITAGQTVTFTNTTTGGAGNFTYSYSLSSSQNVTQQGNKFTFANPGNYSVTLTVTDQLYDRASKTLPITVVSPTPIQTTAAGPSTQEIEIGVGALIVILAAAYYLSTRKKKPAAKKKGKGKGKRAATAKKATKKSSAKRKGSKKRATKRRRRRR